MMQALRFFWRDNKQAIFVLGFAVLLILLGHAVPFVPLEYMFYPTDKAPHWMSIYGDGLSVWFQTILIAEVVLLISRRVQRSALNQAGHVNPFHPVLIAVALIWTLLSSWHYWTYLRGQFIAVDDGPLNWPVVSAVVVTSGLALAILLGMLMERRWAGYGFWLVIVINYGLAIPSEISAALNQVLQMGHEARDWLVLIALVLVPFVAMMASTQISRNVDGKDNREQLFLWASSFAAAGWITGAIAVKYDSIWADLPIIRAAILALLGVVVFFAHDQIWLRLVHVLLLLASLAAYYVLEALGVELAFISGGEILIWAWAATALLQSWRAASAKA